MNLSFLRLWCLVSLGCASWWWVSKQAVQAASILAARRQQQRGLSEADERKVYRAAMAITQGRIQ